MTGSDLPGNPAESDAFELFFRTYYVDLCRFVHGYVRSRDTAADLVHDLFLQLWQRHDRGDPAPLTRQYLYVAARNRALEYLRHQRVVQRWEADAARDSERSAERTDDVVCARDLSKAVDRAVDELPPRCREIFRMSRYQHLANAEIAATLGISVSTVEVQMWRALKKLRVRLAPYLALVTALAPALSPGRLFG